MAQLSSGARTDSRVWPGLLVLAAIVAAFVIGMLIYHHHQVVEEQQTTCQFSKTLQGYSQAEAEIACQDGR